MAGHTLITLLAAIFVLLPSILSEGSKDGPEHVETGGASSELTCQSWCPSSAEQPVLVIGGGIAGVTAAAELLRMGCNVKLIEAKDHLGGRMYGEVQESGWVFNHGANWIHGAYPNPIWALNQEHHLVRTQWLPRTYYTRTVNGVVRDIGNASYVPGQKMRQCFDEFASKHEHFKSWLSLSCNGKFNSRDLPLTYFVREYLRSNNVSGKTLDEFLLFFNAYETFDVAADLYTASMINNIAIRFNQDKEFMVADPYNQIVEFLAEQSGLEVILNEAVRSVKYSDKGVEVVGRSGRIFEGSIAVVTVPVGVLRTPDIEFLPPLPPWKQRAINDMRMGLLEKMYFEYDEAWWEKSGAVEDAFWTVKSIERDAYRSTASEWYNLHNLLNKTVPPVLLTTPAGYFADELEFENDTAVIEIFSQELKRIFPNTSIPSPRHFKRTRHRQDEFQRGSYLAPDVGMNPLSIPYLAEPVAQRVFFAGEATNSVRFGYVDGAYTTGLRVAKQVLSLCRSKDSTVPFIPEGLTSTLPPQEERIRRHWRAEVEDALQMTIPDCALESDLPAWPLQPRPIPRKPLASGCKESGASESADVTSFV